MRDAIEHHEPTEEICEESASEIMSKTHGIDKEFFSENSLSMSEGTMDNQNQPSDFLEAARKLDLNNLMLKPEDLEEVAAIFDKVRHLFRRRDEANQGRRLISKAQMNKLDDLASQFDFRLTEVMMKLSKVLKDELVSNSQK